MSTSARKSVRTGRSAARTARIGWPFVLIRRAGQADLEPALRVMAEAFAMPVQAPSVHTRVARLPHGRLLVADSGGAIMGTGGAVGFGSTAWIGGVTVAPAARGARLGQRLTEAAIAAVGGASTLLLLASEAGRPIYDRLGFEAEGRYRTLTAPAARPVRAALVRPERATVLALDARATGEDRSSVLIDEALAT